MLVHHLMILADDWNRGSCLRSFKALLPLIDQLFSLAETVLIWKSIHFIASLHWTDPLPGKKNSLFSLSIFFFFLQNRPDNDTATEMPDKWAQPEASLPLVLAKTTAPSTSSYAPSSTIKPTSSAGVPQSAMRSNKKLKRSFPVSVEKWFCLVSNGQWLDNVCSSIFKH